MKAVRAIYEHGVFRPLEPVDLPEASEVLVTPEASEVLVTSEVIDPLRPMTDEEAAELYAILGARFRSGFHDTAERHNEHQP